MTHIVYNKKKESILYFDKDEDLLNYIDALFMEKMFENCIYEISDPKAIRLRGRRSLYNPDEIKIFLRVDSKREYFLGQYESKSNTERKHNIRRIK